MNALKKEIKKLSLLTLFFLICFGYILLLMKLFLKGEYSINVYVFSKIILGSLFAAKAVLIMNAIPHIRRFDESPRYIIILYKTSLYTLAVLILGVLEGVIEAHRKTKAFGPAVAEFLHGKNFDRVLAVTLCIGAVFLIYNILKELDTYLGKGKLRQFFLTPPER